MVRTLAHRGPDGEGLHFYRDCALGHRRLSIVDLVSGAQPMLSPDGQVGIVFNGEIYGFQEIRSKLRDYPFVTTSDTEVMLALYARHGAEMLARLPGMFAFALWDDRSKELFCARDRFGEKPFYYAQTKDGSFVFASEIKGILASGLIEPVLDESSLVHYLHRLYVHPHKTIYANIHALPPAHMLRYSEGQIRLQRYWSLPPPVGRIGLTEAVEEFQRLTDRAVRQQLVADVPVAAFLSGGLDSSTIVALATRHHPRIKTFAFGFGTSINELPFAQQIAEKYQTEHCTLSDETEDLVELLLKMQEVYDEPFADSSNIPTYLISRMTRKHVPVVLSGDGGDELLGGYTFWYRALFKMQRAVAMPALARPLIRWAHGFLSRRQRPIPAWLADVVQGRDVQADHDSVLDAHYHRTTYFHDHELRLLGLSSMALRDQPIWPRSDSLDSVLRADLQDYMPGDILVKTDRAAMANSLELRAPFLDVDLASFCIGLPLSLKITSTTDKRIMREAFASSWTPEIRARGKQGFGAPVQDWLKLDSMRALVHEYLENPRAKLFSHVSYEATRPFVETGTYKTWILLVLAIWMEKHAFSDRPR
jgi:asparagine synthase (glutamine-hydrolysing)